MITAFRQKNGSLVANPLTERESVPADVVWIDLLNPTEHEEEALEHTLGVDIPTWEEMQEIEVSSRLYQKDRALYMTAILVSRADTDSPESAPVTFVLADHRLITLRYADPSPFRAFVTHIQRMELPCTSGEDVLGNLLDAIVDRLADILERTQHELDKLSRLIFKPTKSQAEGTFQDVLRRIGLAQGLTARARESLGSIDRLISFLGRPGEGKPETLASRTFRNVARDVSSLNDHAMFLSNNFTFILDATLGMINSEQTSIIKIFSVAAVVFLPPTLIASIYGMNFEFMPELKWPWGYPLSLGMMVLSAVLPYWYFKHKGWL